ncbi:pupal cuticle protein 36a-like [Penaeus monodon]|uniref:pupal cuticle protein 36a-like n=1 Tax=Penaeus monodon TaxID=6687 RepID=UPI0018A76E61|nr:pupal cuticle protein 36a-like [Penaeus monodon]
MRNPDRDAGPRVLCPEKGKTMVQVFSRALYDCASAVKGSRDGRKQPNQLIICSVIAVVASLPEGSPSTSYGTPSAGGLGGSSGSGFGSRGSGGFGGATGSIRAGTGGHFGGAGGIRVTSGATFGSSFQGIRGSTGGGFGGSAGRFGGSGSEAGGYSGSSGPVIPILRDDRLGPDEFGNYYFNFETGNGISRQEQGAPQGPTGAVTSQGAWSFVFPDGTPANFEFIADGNGYRVQSDLLPTPPPLPAHAIAQIEKARQEDAAAAASGGGGGYSGQAGASQSGFGSGHFSGASQSDLGFRQFIGAGQSQFAGLAGQTSGSGQPFSGSTLSQIPSTSYAYP